MNAVINGQRYRIVCLYSFSLFKKFRFRNKVKTILRGVMQHRKLLAGLLSDNKRKSCV